MADDDFLKDFPRLDFSYRIPEFHPPDLGLSIPDLSATGLLEHLDQMIAEWRKGSPDDAQPIIHAILANGVTIEAREFADAGPNAIAIRGRLADGSECLMLTHQSSLQLLCRIVKAENPQQRYPIGFRYDKRAE